MADINPALGTAPIAGAAPTGENARYDPNYEALEAEIKKMESLTGEVVAWPKVLELATKLLAEKTKDVLVSSYLCMGAFQTGGYAALAPAIVVQKDLIKTFWDNLWPEQKRMRARVTAVQWFNDRVAVVVVNRGQPSEQDREGLEKCAAAMKELGDVVAEKFTEERPDLGAMTRAIADKISLLAGGEATTGGGEAMAETGGEAGGATSASSGQGGGGGGPIKGRADAFKKLQEVANWLKRNDPHSPVAMLVQRAVAWGSMSLEQVLSELVRNNDVRDRIFDELGVKKETPPAS